MIGRRGGKGGVMASKYWIKLYHEILDDPKMGLLPDRAWRRCIELFLLAGEQEDGGRLPTLKEMAWRLRVDYGELEADFADLEHAEIIHRDGDHWVVTKFAERQEAVSPAERTRRFRERQRKDQFKTSDMNGHPGNGGGDDDVTTRKRNVTQDETKPVTNRYTEVDKDIELEKNPTTTRTHAGSDEQFGQVTALLTERGLYLDGFTSQLVQECFDDIKPQGDETKLDWFRYACEESAGNKPNWKYFEAIIRGVNDSGSLSAHRANREQSKARPDKSARVYVPKTVQELVKQNAENSQARGLF